MPDYVLNRNYTHRSTFGHVINFAKGEPTHVPPHIEREIIAIGGERVDGERSDPLGEEVNAPVPLAPDERIAQVKLAFELLVEKNDPKDFTGAGVPTVKAVKRIVGFDVDRNEVAETWAAVRAGE